jgi:hypothetical protein
MTDQEEIIDHFHDEEMDFNTLSMCATNFKNLLDLAQVLKFCSISVTKTRLRRPIKVHIKRIFRPVSVVKVLHTCVNS